MASCSKLVTPSAFNSSSRAAIISAILMDCPVRTKSNSYLLVSPGIVYFFVDFSSALVVALIILSIWALVTYLGAQSPI